jgi:hypothetical protein
VHGDLRIVLDSGTFKDPPSNQAQQWLKALPENVLQQRNGETVRVVVVVVRPQQRRRCGQFFMEQNANCFQERGSNGQIRKKHLMALTHRVLCMHVHILGWGNDTMVTVMVIFPSTWRRRHVRTQLSKPTLPMCIVATTHGG